MKLFTYSTHVNQSLVEFLGDCWEDGCVFVNDDGQPVSDIRGNTIAVAECRPIEAGDVAAIREAYCGDDGIDDWDHFRSWLLRECDLAPADTNKVLIGCGWSPDFSSEPVNFVPDITPAISSDVQVHRYHHGITE